jgi:hypothetical protein
LKVPRYCQLVLLVEIHLREVTAVGSEKSKFMVWILLSVEEKSREGDFTTYDRNYFAFGAGRAALE